MSNIFLIINLFFLIYFKLNKMAEFRLKKEIVYKKYITYNMHLLLVLNIFLHMYKC
ncbi:hypothetical protein NUSPORA_01675 [Nucleospora cyclopteri]